MPQATYREIRLHAGYFQVANAEAGQEVDRLPESPSAVVREAIEFWLDQFAPSSERHRSDREWEARLQPCETPTADAGKPTPFLVDPNQATRVGNTTRHCSPPPDHCPPRNA